MDDFRITFDKLAGNPDESDSLPLAIMKYICFYLNNDYKKLQILLNTHETYDELHKRYIQTLIDSNNIQKALSECQSKYSNTYKRAIPYTKLRYVTDELTEYHKLSNKEREEYDALNPISYLYWYAEKQLELLIKLQKTDEALKLVTDINLDRQTYSRWFRTECYANLAPHLNTEQKNDFVNNILSGNKFIVLDIEEFCEVDNNWQNLITAFRLRGTKLSDIIVSVETYKEHLMKYPKQLIDMYSNVILEYVVTDSKKPRHPKITLAMNNLLKIEKVPDKLLVLILTLKIKLKRRKALIELLDKFLVDNDLVENFIDFLQTQPPKLRELLGDKYSLADLKVLWPKETIS